MSKPARDLAVGVACPVAVQPLADQRRAVAGLLEPGGHGVAAVLHPVPAVGVEVAPDAVVVRVLAGDEGRSRRAAERKRVDRAGERGPLPRQEPPDVGHELEVGASPCRRSSRRGCWADRRRWRPPGAPGLSAPRSPPAAPPRRASRSTAACGPKPSRCPCVALLPIALAARYTPVDRDRRRARRLTGARSRAPEAPRRSRPDPRAADSARAPEASRPARRDEARSRRRGRRWSPPDPGDPRRSSGDPPSRAPRRASARRSACARRDNGSVDAPGCARRRGRSATTDRRPPASRAGARSRKGRRTAGGRRARC